MSSSPKKKRGSGGGEKDAFAFLMKSRGTATGSSGKKRSRPATTMARPSPAFADLQGSSSSSSRFIECPACLRNVVFERLNAHLDSGCISNIPSPPRLQQNPSTKCAAESESNRQAEDADVLMAAAASEEVADADTADKDDNDLSPSNDNKDDSELQTDNAVTPTPPSPAAAPVAKTKPSSKSQGSGGGVFAKMMAKSQEVFSSKPAVTHYFHLHDVNGKLSWTDTRSSNNGPFHGDDTAIDSPEGDGSSSGGGAPFIAGEATNEYLKASFSATIRVRPIPGYGGQRKQQIDLLTHGRDIDLVITSLVPSAALSAEKGFGLVKRHSRLSVPVLKSMLQKNIRRRRPLPAVRVAMELADKSYADLIRRLPIMVLEDSILHDDFPLLIWLMVAESRGFKPPQPLMIKLMRIVFEVASCPIKDPLPSDEIDDGEDIDLTDALGPDCEMMLRSILLRISYGGMKCDTEMLMRYERLWRKRFHAQAEGPDITETTSQAKAASKESTSEAKLEATAHVTVAGGDHLRILWSDLPANAHEKLAVQSQDKVPNLIISRLDKLSSSDCIHAGVDFHCSSVLESILSDEKVVVAIVERTDCNRSEDNVEESAMQVAKSCMWRYSSGVNHKRDLNPPNDGEGTTNEDKLKALWDDVLSEPAKEYMSRYVTSRLMV